MSSRNKSQQRQVQALVFYHVEIGSRTHGRSIYLDITDAAMREKSADILSEEEHGRIGKGVFIVAIHDKLAGAKHLLVGLVDSSNLQSVCIEKFRIEVIHGRVRANLFFIVSHSLFVFQLTDFFDRKFPAFIADAEVNLVLGGMDDLIDGGFDMQQNQADRFI